MYKKNEEEIKYTQEKKEKNQSLVGEKKRNVVLNCSVSIEGKRKKKVSITRRFINTLN